MSAEIGSGQVWIMAGKLPAMKYQPQIEELVTRGRKRGLAVVMGFQNVSQLRSIYGRDGAITLTSAPTTKIILRCDEAETAKWQRATRQPRDRADEYDAISRPLHLSRRR